MFPFKSRIFVFCQFVSSRKPQKVRLEIPKATRNVNGDNIYIEISKSDLTIADKNRILQNCKLVDDFFCA